VQDALLVGVVDRPRERLDEPGGRGRRQRPGPGQVVPQAAAADVLLHQVRRPGPLPDGQQRDDVRVPQPGQRVPLGPEPLPGLLGGGQGTGQHLDGDRVAAGAGPGEVDDAHPAAAEFPLDLVVGQGRPVGAGQGGLGGALGALDQCRRRVRGRGGGRGVR